MSIPNQTAFSVKEVADHIFQIPVPLPDNPLKVLNSYLIRDGSHSLLIDTGFRLDACRKALLAGLKELGQDPADMDIFVTHLHADHSGLAPELAGPGHTIYVSEQDYGPLAERDTLDAHWRGNMAMFRQAALPESIVSVMDAANPAIAYAAIHGREKYTPVKDGHVISIAGYHLRCILTPGHTPGHMCLWDEKTRIMFTGDHVLFDITPNITTWPFVRDSLGDYLDSLRAVEQYPVTLALPGHRGSGCFRERVQELLSHHQARLEEVLSLVIQHPGSTTYDLAGKMVWSIRASSWEEFPAAQKIFAVGECQSHLDHLLNKRLICYETDGIIRRYYPFIHSFQEVCMQDLTGKYAIVTGGGKGIGAAIVKRFLLEGAAGVAIFDYDEALAKETARQLGGNILVCKCDVSKDDQVKAAVNAALSAFGRIDILVNNAGITRDSMFHKMTDDQWNQVIDINLNGPYNCCKYVVPLMREQNYGKIVNISSSSANGNVGQANYSATKAALIGFTKTLAKELAAKGITANAIAPAMIDTDMMRAVPEQLLNIYLKSCPTRRFGSVDELASAALFLSSDDSSFVNGIVLPVNGGMFT